MRIKEYLIKKLDSNGFVFIEKFLPRLNTEQVALKLGRIVEIEKEITGSNIPNVQILRPKKESTLLANQYSGFYGLGEFPFHSDLAHWNFPP